MGVLASGEDQKHPGLPAVLVRPNNLPEDIVHRREAEWLAELQSRLSAVQAWRGETHVQPKRALGAVL